MTEKWCLGVVTGVTSIAGGHSTTSWPPCVPPTHWPGPPVGNQLTDAGFMDRNNEDNCVFGGTCA